MWNDYSTIDGVEFGHTYLPPFLRHCMDTELVKRWQRPAIMLTRGSIHKLNKLPKEKLIEALYAAAKHSENIHSQQVKYNKAHSGYKYSPPYKNKPGYVYFLYSETNGLMKIGCSANPAKRKTQIERNHSTKLELVGTIKTGAMYEMENEIHCLYESRRHEGEWFRINPSQLRIAARYLKRKSKVAA